MGSWERRTAHLKKLRADDPEQNEEFPEEAMGVKAKNLRAHATCGINYGALQKKSWGGGDEFLKKRVR